MTNLLIPEYPLIVLPTLAKTIGLNEAIFLQQIHYISTKSKNGMVYLTAGQLAEKVFPFWSSRTIERIVASLKEKELLYVTKPEGFNRTNHYQINYDDLPFRQLGGIVSDSVAESLKETSKEKEVNSKQSASPKRLRATHPRVLFGSLDQHGRAKDPKAAEKKVVELAKEEDILETVARSFFWYWQERGWGKRRDVKAALLRWAEKEPNRGRSAWSMQMKAASLP